MRIATVGGGPGGLYFALLAKLRHPDFDVTVYERNSEDSIDGYGLVFWDDLLGELYENDADSARSIEQSMFYWANQVITLRGTPVVDTESSGYSIHRQDLLRVLAKRATSLGVRIEHRHEVRSRDEIAQVDLVVASDGVNSKIRSSHSSHFGTHVDAGRNKYLWLAADKVFESFEFDFVKVDAGLIWSAAYGFDQSTSTFVVECPPETWTGLGLDTASTAECLATLERVFERQLDGHHLFTQQRGDEPLAWRSFRTLTNRCWHANDVVLLGDAAHTTHFSIGSGTRLALEDAICLVNHLDLDLDREAAFNGYERERKEALARPQAEARSSARWHEQVERYAGLSPERFQSLWILRRSLLLPHINPRLYYALHAATSKVPLLRRARDELGLRVRGQHRMDVIPPRLAMGSSDVPRR